MHEQVVDQNKTEDQGNLKTSPVTMQLGTMIQLGTMMDMDVLMDGVDWSFLSSFPWRKKRVKDGPTEGPTDEPMDKASYRDA